MTDDLGPARVVAALALVTLASPACVGGTACDCADPSVAYKTVPVKAAQGNPIVAAAADRGCRVTADGTRTSLAVACHEAGVWWVRAQLASGDVYAFAVQVQTTSGGCCGPGLQITNSPAVQRSDAGIDARD